MKKNEIKKRETVISCFLKVLSIEVDNQAVFQILKTNKLLCLLYRKFIHSVTCKNNYLGIKISLYRLCQPLNMILGKDQLNLNDKIE